MDSIHPQVITTTDCGHTLCARCIVSWYFTNMDATTCSWPRNVACPICDQPTVAPKAGQPRKPLDFPFTPNRAAEAILSDIMETLTGLVDNLVLDGMVTDPPDSELWSSKLAWRKQGKVYREWDSSMRYVIFPEGRVGLSHSSNQVLEE